MIDEVIAHLLKAIQPLVNKFSPYVGAFIGGIAAIVTMLVQRRKDNAQKERDLRIDSKLDLLLKAGGLTWKDAGKSASKSSLIKTYLRYFSLRVCLAQLAGLSIVWLENVKLHLREMLSMSKSWLIGLIGYVAMFVKSQFNIEVPTEAVDMIADIILLIIPLVAIFTNRKKGEANAQLKADDHEFIG